MSVELRNRLESLISDWVTDSDERAAVLAGKPLAEAMNVDSMALLDLVVRIEEAFAVVIEAENLEALLQSIDTIEAGLSRLTDA